MCAAPAIAVASLLLSLADANRGCGASAPACAAGAPVLPPFGEPPPMAAVARQLLGMESKQLLKEASPLLLVQKGASLAGAEAAASARDAEALQTQSPEAPAPTDGIYSVVLSGGKAVAAAAPAETISHAPLRAERDLAAAFPAGPAMGTAITAGAVTSMLFSGAPTASEAAAGGSGAALRRQAVVDSTSGSTVEEPEMTVQQARHSQRWPGHLSVPLPTPGNASSADAASNSSALLDTAGRQHHHLDMSVSPLHPLEGLDAFKPYHDFATPVERGDEKIPVATGSEELLREVARAASEGHGDSGGQAPEFLDDDSAESIVDRFLSEGLESNAVQHLRDQDQLMDFAKTAICVLGPLVLVAGVIAGIVSILNMARTRTC